MPGPDPTAPDRGDSPSIVASAYCADTSELRDEQVEQLQRFLSGDERARYARRVRADDRREFATAHALLRLALAEWLDTTADRLTFSATPNGKPVLSSPPLGDAAPRFSLTHTRNLVACVIARERAVGIDAESIGAATHTIDIAHRFFSSEESATLAQTPVTDQPARFYEMWTLKEALFKAIGGGLGIPLRSASFRVGDGTIQLTQTPPLAGDAWSFALRQHGGHLLAIALGGSLEPPAFVRLSSVDPLSLVGGRVRSIREEMLLLARTLNQ